MSNADHYTVRPGPSTDLISMHLDNDARHHGRWTERAEEIRKSPSSELALSLRELWADDVMTLDEVVLSQLADEIKEYIDNATTGIIRDGDMRPDAVEVGLVETMAERFIASANWQSVAASFVSDDHLPEQYK